TSAEVGPVRVVTTDAGLAPAPVADFSQRHLTDLQGWLGIAPRPVTVALFTDRSAYAAYGKAEIPGFHPRMDFCYSPAEQAVVGYRTGESELQSRLRHELFHHLSAGRPVRLPLWLEEGTAELIEGLAPGDGGRLVLVRVQSDHLRTAARSLLRGGEPAVQTVLAGGRKALAADPRGYYAMGYALALHLFERGELGSAVATGLAQPDLTAFRAFVTDQDRWTAAVGRPLPAVAVATR
ncbi:MAG: hypothetical protein RLZZ127_1855, partial [Planctomycetota bacterium]